MTTPFVGQRVHLLGSLGSGMQSLAKVLQQSGAVVTGSDEQLLEPESQFLPIELDLVIASAAIPADHPELTAARRRGVRVISYPQALALWTAQREVIAVAGTHGKSTTAAMLAWILHTAGDDVGLLVGAEGKRGPLGHHGSSRRCVVEACEYRRHFLEYQTTQAAVLAVEPDHFDAFPTDRDLDQAFEDFVRSLPRSGGLLLNADSPRSLRLRAFAACPVETVGEGPADWQYRVGDVEAGRFSFFLSYQEEPLLAVRLGIPGRFQVANAAMAASFALKLGIASQGVQRGLETFPGVSRRGEVLAEQRGIARIDDYAHHPTAVAAILALARNLYPTRRLVAVFQPHQASRTARLLDELAASLQNVDILAVAEIYRAREPKDKMGEILTRELARQTAALGVAVLPEHGLDQLRSALQAVLCRGDVFLTIGAGNLGDFANVLD